MSRWDGFLEKLACHFGTISVGIVGTGVVGPLVYLLLKGTPFTPVGGWLAHFLVPLWLSVLLCLGLRVSVPARLVHLLPSVSATWDSAQKILLYILLPAAITLLFWDKDKPQQTAGVAFLALVLDVIVVRAFDFTVSHKEMLQQMQGDLGFELEVDRDYTHAVRALNDTYRRVLRPEEKEFIKFFVGILAGKHLGTSIAIEGDFGLYERILASAASRAIVSIRTVLPLGPATEDVATVLEMDSLLKTYYEAVSNGVTPIANRERWIIAPADSLRNDDYFQRVEALSVLTRNNGFMPRYVLACDVRQHMQHERDFMMVDHGTGREMTVEGVLGNGRRAGGEGAGVGAAAPQWEVLKRCLREFHEGKIDKDALERQVRKLPMTIFVRMRQDTGNEAQFLARLIERDLPPDSWETPKAIREEAVTRAEAGAGK